MANPSSENLRRSRLDMFRKCVCSDFGCVNQAMAAWLLCVSRQRVSCLVQGGFLVSHRKIDGALLIPFVSVQEYATKNRRKRLEGLKLLRSKILS